jgi:hypothetical protein
LLFRRQELGDDAQVAATDATFIARLHQQAAIHAAIFVTNAGRREAASRQHANIFFTRADFERFRVDFGSEDQLDELALHNRARGVRGERTIESNDAAEC